MSPTQWAEVVTSPWIIWRWRVAFHGDDSDDHAEIRFETQRDATVAIERLNELFKKATGMSFSSSGMRGT